MASIPVTKITQYYSERGILHFVLYSQNGTEVVYPLANHTNEISNYLLQTDHCSNKGLFTNAGVPTFFSKESKEVSVIFKDGVYYQTSNFVDLENLLRRVSLVISQLDASLDNSIKIPPEVYEGTYH